MTCECKLCTLHREVEAAKQGSRREMKLMIDRLHDLYTSEAEDRNWAHCIIDGSWPGADDIIALSRARRGPVQ